ncbi:MAG: hypothetical protein WA418_06435 [Bradyrhizobium sp.]
MAHHAPDRRLREDFGVVFDPQLGLAGAHVEVEEQVHLRGADFRLQPLLPVYAVERPALVVDVDDVEHRAKQRVSLLQAVGSEPVHQPLERIVLHLVGPGDHGMCRPDELLDRLRRGETRTQRHRIGEETGDGFDLRTVVTT